jgi:hypothetical protein
MIKSSITETRYDLNVPWFKPPEEWIEEYGGQIMPGSSITYYDGNYKRTFVNWYFGLEELNNFTANPEVSEQWNLRIKHNMENNIILTRTLEKVSSEEYDKYVEEHTIKEEPTTT